MLSKTASDVLPHTKAAVESWVDDKAVLKCLLQTVLAVSLVLFW